MNAGPAHHFQLGKALLPLREAGVLILASGDGVHNIDKADEHAIDADPPEYAYQFDRWLEKQILTDQTAMLLDFRQQAPQPQRSHPYPHEHLLTAFRGFGDGQGCMCTQVARFISVRYAFNGCLGVGLVGRIASKRAIFNRVLPTSTELFTIPKNTSGLRMTLTSPRRCRCICRRPEQCGRCHP